MGIKRKEIEELAASCKVSVETAMEAGAAALSGDLEEASKLLGGYGVEYCALPGGDGIGYINMGDTYNVTLIWDDEPGTEIHNLRIRSWGDEVEVAEAEYCESEGVVRCGYCGVYVELPEGSSWRDVLCGCGRYVDGREA